MSLNQQRDIEFLPKGLHDIGQMGMSGRLKEVLAAVDETIALFHRLRWVAEQIYGPAGRSTARRGILRGLVRYGAQTVPALARARGVTKLILLGTGGGPRPRTSSSASAQVIVSNGVAYVVDCGDGVASPGPMS